MFLRRQTLRWRLARGLLGSAFGIAICGRGGKEAGIRGSWVLMQTNEGCSKPHGELNVKMG